MNQDDILRTQVLDESMTKGPSGSSLFHSVYADLIVPAATQVDLNQTCRVRAGYKGQSKSAYDVGR
jgi:hypothetical protein